MSIYGPNGGHRDLVDRGREVGEDTIRYFKNAVKERVSKDGDFMTGVLNMTGNLIRGLPTLHPPRYQGDEAVSYGQVINMVLDSQASALRLDGSSVMSGDLHMEDHHIKNVSDPIAPKDAANKAYVDDGVRSRPYFLKLKCGEGTERTILFRDFFIPNRNTRFGLEKNRLFISYSVRHASGASTPCTIVRLKVDEDFLRVRFALVAPWVGKLILYTRVDVLSSGANVEHLDHMLTAGGQLVDWE